MNIIEFSKHLATILPDFELQEGSNYIVKHKIMPIVIYPQVSVGLSWSKPSQNVNSQSLTHKIRRLIFRFMPENRLEDFKEENPREEINRKLEFGASFDGDLTSSHREMIYERISSLKTTTLVFNSWLTTKLAQEISLEDQFKKVQEELAKKQKIRLERYKSRSAIFTKLQAHFDSIGVQVDSIHEGEYLNVTLKNGTKAKVVATENGAYLSEIVVVEDYQQASMANLFKRLDTLGNI